MISCIKQKSDSPQILIVDDTLSNLKLLAELLSEHGYQVRPISSSLRALKSVAIEKPDLILLDVMMPEMDGYEVCQRLKLDKHLCDIPVIFISALDETVNKVKGFKAGGVDYITKPFQKEEVLIRVETHLALSNLQQQVQARNVQLEQEIVLRKKVEEELLKTQEELKLLSEQDGLTGIFNRRYFDEFLERKWRQGKRQGTQITLIMADIDYFKRYNDIYGHQAGDACLKSVANVLKATLKRGTDLVARFGGEEFSIVLTGTDKAEAVLLAEEIRANVEALAIELDGSIINGAVTISLGVATAIPGQNSTPAAIIAAADKALYWAKQEGRNRVMFYERRGED